jgi:hypothetical protein
MLTKLVLIFLASLSLGFCEDDLRGDFLYEGEKVPEVILDNFFTLAITCSQADLELDIAKSIREYEQVMQGNCDKELADKFQRSPGDIFTWQFIGAVYQDYQIVRIYSWGEGNWGKHIGLLILKREGNLLKITDVIAIGDRHASMIYHEGCLVEGHKVFFIRGETTASFVDMALKIYPELISEYDRSAKAQLTYGEESAGVCSKYVAEITSEGKVQIIKHLGFVPGGDPGANLYQKDDVKALVLTF